MISMLFLLVLLARLDNWIFKNETFSNLAFGFQIGEENESLTLLKQAAERNCNLHANADLGLCLGYQNILGQNAFFGHPLTAAFGRSLLSTYSGEGWLETLQLTAVSAQAFGGLVALFLSVVFLVALPGRARLVAATALLAVLLLGFLRDDGPSVFPDLMDDGPQWWEAIAIALAAGLLLLPARAAWPVHSDASRGWIESHPSRAKLLPTAALILLILHSITPEVLTWVPQIAGFLLLIYCAALLVRGQNQGVWILVLVALLFVFLLISAGEANLLRRPEDAKHQLFFAFGAFCAYVAAAPQGRLVWMLPVLGVFHFPALGVLSLALFLAELPLCVKRKKISLLSVVTLVTAAGCTLLTNTFENDLVGTHAVRFAPIAEMFVGSELFLPTLLSAVVVLALSLWMLLSSEEGSNEVARVGFLLAQALVIISIAQVIREADAGLRLQPGFFVFADLPRKVVPGITFAAVAMLALALNDALAGLEDPRASEAAAPVRRFLPSLLFAFILAVGCSKLELRLRPVVWEAAQNTYAYFWAQALDERWRCNFGPIAGADDRYALSLSNPTNDPINFLSKLKLLLRQTLGAHDPAKMEIETVATDEKSCLAPLQGGAFE